MNCEFDDTFADLLDLDLDLDPSPPATWDLALNLNLSVQSRGGVGSGTAAHSSSYGLRPIYPNLTASSGLSDQNLQLVRPQPTTRSRRIHTKSRSGCYTCKRRRIKCPENLPSCSNCLQRNLKCEWPEAAAEAVGQGSPLGASLPAQVQSSRPTFSMQDFRLFHHFVQEAHPHQPVGNDSVWKHEIPSIAHNYDFLLHSMLGLAASHLFNTHRKTPELEYSAIAHRVKAMKSLRETVAKRSHTFEEANAMFAACYNLFFQACYLDDGIAEFMTLIRGAVLIGIHMGTHQMRFLFNSVMAEEQLAKVEPGLMSAPTINAELVNAAIASLEALEPLCQREHEKSFLSALLQTTISLLTSSQGSYVGIMTIYGEFAFKMTQAEFDSFVDPANNVGRLLQSHFVALQTIMAPIATTEMLGRKPTSAPNMSVRWLSPLHRNIKPDMRKYFEWPIAQEALVKSQLECITLGDCNAIASA